MSHEECDALVQDYGQSVEALNFINIDTVEH